MRLFTTIATICLAVSGVGCDTTAGRRDLTSFQRQRIGGIEYGSAMEAAEMALAERFHIASRDSDAGVVRAAPLEGRSGEAREPSRMALGTPARSRRVAEVRVVEEAGETEFLCRVQVQQLESDPFRSRHYDRGGFDEPRDTPAQREASTTPEQNALWLTKRRDRAMERAILAAIRERLGER